MTLGQFEDKFNCLGARNEINQKKTRRVRNIKKQLINNIDKMNDKSN